MTTLAAILFVSGLILWGVAWWRSHQLDQFADKLKEQQKVVIKMHDQAKEHLTKAIEHHAQANEQYSLADRRFHEAQALLEDTLRIVRRESA